ARLELGGRPVPPRHRDRRAGHGGPGGRPGGGSGPGRDLRRRGGARGHPEPAHDPLRDAASPPRHRAPLTNARGGHRGTRGPGAGEEGTTVRVGPAFVAVTIGRPDRGEALLEPILRAVTATFAEDAGPGPESGPAVPAAGRAVTGEGGEARAPRRLERAWAD